MKLAMTLSTLSLLALTATAMADTTPATAAATSTTTADTSTLAKIKEKVSLKFASTYVGQSIMSPIAVDMPNSDTDTTSGGGKVYFAQYLMGSYKINSTTKLTPTLYWSLSPMQGVTAKLNDPYLVLSKSKIFESGNYSIAAADLRLGAGISKGSRDSNHYGYIRSTQSQNYDFGKSDISLGFTTFEQIEGYKSPQGTKMLTLYAGPALNYKISEKISAFALYEIYGHNTGGAFSTFAMDGMDFEPGLSFDITQDLSLSPYLNIMTTHGIKSMTFNSTQYLFDLSWKFF